MSSSSSEQLCCLLSQPRVCSSGPALVLDFQLDGLFAKTKKIFRPSELIARVHQAHSSFQTKTFI